MEFTEKISLHITNIIKNTLPEKSKVELEQINYGLHILISNAFKLPIVFITAYFLGILKYTIVSFLAFSFLRCFASGMHAKKGITCLISTAVIFLGTAFLGIKINLNIPDVSVAFGTCLVLVYLYAPCDTEEKPYVSKRLRKKLKILSCISIFVLYFLSLYFINTSYGNIITFSVLAECISILPITHSIFKRRFNNYEIFNG